MNQGKFTSRPRDFATAGAQRPVGANTSRVTPTGYADQVEVPAANSGLKLPAGSSIPRTPREAACITG